MTYASIRHSNRGRYPLITSWALMLLAFTSSCAGGFRKDLSQAEAAYSAGEKETAKSYYQAAAAKGSAEAHFALAYKYIVTQEESIYHYSFAAEMGHEKALASALEALFFRANSLRFADPHRALELYHTAKKRNPSIVLFNEEGDLRTMQKCVEAGEFDAVEFGRKYDIDIDKEDIWYGVWKLAEEASRGGRFGEPDPWLVFQLIMRGGDVPAELGYAVKDFYEHWKNDRVVEFNICDYITSGFGMGFCAHRWIDETELERQTQIEHLSEGYNLVTQRILSEAYNSGVTFIKIKAVNEECHGGSARPAWIVESENEQRDSLLALITRVSQGYTPNDILPLSTSEARFQETSDAVLEQVDSIRANNSDCSTAYGLEKVKRVWPDYRDNAAKLFAALNPSLSEKSWRSWLTEQRREQLLNYLKY